MASGSGVTAALLRRVAQLAGKRVTEILPYEAGAAEVMRLFAPCRTVTYAPRGVNGRQRSAESEFPPITLKLFEDATVTPRSSHIVTERGMFVSPFRFRNQSRVPSNGMRLGYYDETCAVIREGHDEEIECGVMLFGEGAFNWYHWMFEMLPVPFLAELGGADLAGIPLLVPAGCLKIPSMVESLEILYPGRRLIAMEHPLRYRVRRLYHVDALVSGPFNLNRGFWPEIPDFTFNAGALRAFAAQLRERTGVAGISGDERVFVARGGVRRGYNEEALARIAQDRGFRILRPERVSLREQAAIFASADIVAGASGAAWSNLLFRDAPGAGLSWLFPEYAGFGAYATLGEIFGCPLRFLFPEALTPFSTTDEAYRASYEVDTGAFADALDEVCHLAAEAA